jgi:hypothetical protein
MLFQKLTRVQPLIHCRLSVPRPYRLYPPALLRTIAMAHPVASSSHPAQLPALDSPHAASAQTPKVNKEKKQKVVDGSAYPLEVGLGHASYSAAEG